MHDNIKKNVDESWKEAISKEKETLKSDSNQTSNDMPPEPTFSFFTSTLALQASVFLGQIPDPATNKKIKNLSQAKFIIDTMAMLKDKTVNNLTDDEANLLENVLYELRMQYVNIAKSEV
ncbi:MAG: DUF1844 domain-containing protein [Candidatus Omnitrophota bacterium]